MKHGKKGGLFVGSCLAVERDSRGLKSKAG
jgi:hypothetical protein